MVDLRMNPCLHEMAFPSHRNLLLEDWEGVGTDMRSKEVKRRDRQVDPSFGYRSRKYILRACRGQLLDASGGR